MPLLDRSIAREYLINALTLLVVLLSFIVAIDVSLNIGRFAKAAEEVASQGGEPAGLIRRGLVTVWLIGDFWWPKLLQLYNYLLGIVLVGAMGFTCVQLVRHRETVAVLASGLTDQQAHYLNRPDDYETFGWSEPPAVDDTHRAAMDAAEELTDRMLAPAFAAVPEADRAA